MINFLVIYVAQTAHNYTRAAENIIAFLDNLIAHSVFVRHEDRFVVYLEDLYERELNNFSKNVEKILIDSIRARNIKYFRIETNTVKSKIIDFCKSNRADPSIEHRINLYYKIARIAIAPTLIKELIQQFGLHYETITTKSITVYHDLDMRYSPVETYQPNYRHFYTEFQKHPIMAHTPVKSGCLPMPDFDVYWAMNTYHVQENNVFLDTFYNTLYFTVYFTYWKNEIPRDSERDFAQIQYELNFLLKNHALRPEYKKNFLQEYGKPDIILHFEQLNGSDATAAIIALHSGLRVNPPFRGLFLNPSKKNKFYGLCLPFFGAPRATIFPYLFMFSYILPFQKFYAELANDPLLCKFERFHIYHTLNMPSFYFKDISDFAKDLDIWHAGLSRTTTQSMYESVSDPQNTTQFEGLLKHSTRRWTQIPFLNEEEIPDIIKKYTFMKNVLDVTTPLRFFATADLDSSQKDDAYLLNSVYATQIQSYMRSLLSKRFVDSQRLTCAFCYTKNAPYNQCTKCQKYFCHQCFSNHMD